MAHFRLIVVLIAVTCGVLASPIEDKLKELDADIELHDAEEEDKCGKEKLNVCTTKLLEYATDDSFPVPETEADVRDHCE